MAHNESATNVSTDWSPGSWRNHTIKHIPNYPNEAKLKEVCESLQTSPPLIFAGEARSLKAKLALATEGKAFLLQGGDCAESFNEFSANNIRDVFRVLLQMAVIITSGLNKPVIKLGRIAGQFAKPRSSDTEVINGVELPSYKGDIINGVEFTPEARTPDPERIVKAYHQSALTLNLLRAFAVGGYADLHQVHSWNMGFVEGRKQGDRYAKVANKIQSSLNFIEALGINSDNTPQLREIEYFTSHEALLLPYEEAMTRIDSTYGDVYDTSAHFFWIGDRTRFVGSAHVEFCRGINNPIGIKCGPSLDCDELIKIVDTINPKNTAGRITLITRYGDDKVAEHLPGLVRRIQQEGKQVLWSSDPMHGNVEKSSTGFKTRPFERILSELKQCIEIHKSENSYLGGIHLEMTGKDVTECTGGMTELSDEQLFNRYHTQCDPRLNATQAIELAFLISDHLHNLHN